MKPVNWGSLFMILGVLFFSVPHEGAAYSSSSENDASVRQLGVAWNMADDRKMENIAGVKEPEGLDKYMQRYFVQFGAKLDELSAKVDKLSQQVAQMNERLAQKDTSRNSSQGRLV